MSKIRIFALGGLDEDGKNMYIVENGNDIFAIECGMKYPGADQLGIEMIIPDFEYLKENADRVKGVFITHGHDDVIGALANLLKEVKVPVYMAPLTAKLFDRRAKKEGLKDYEIHRVRRNGQFKIGQTEIRTFGTTQSIADGFGVAIRTEDGYVVYTSEFIVDYDTKTDAFKFDMTDIMEIGRRGVLALLSESVGATREGHSAPQHRITKILEPYFEDAKGRIIVTTYSQNLYRVIELVELAKPMSITFHKAIDEIENPENEILTLAEVGIDRILTSGKKATAFEGAELLNKFIKIAQDKIKIIVCGGVTSDNFQQINKLIPSTEYHGKKIV